MEETTRIALETLRESGSEREKKLAYGFLYLSKALRREKDADVPDEDTGHQTLPR